MRCLGWLVGALCLLAGGVPSFAAEDATLLGEFGAWRAYKASGPNMLCFAASVPIRRLPAALRRGHGFVFVSYRQSERVRDEISLVLGYPLQSAATSRLTVEDTSFELMEQGEAAWLASAGEQQQAVQAFRRGRMAYVETTSARRNSTRDEYSLSGFTRAYAAMSDACEE